MIQSMTGFAEKRFDFRTLSAKFSIRSLNHRFLDWNYRGAQVGRLENRLRAILQKKVHRGRIEVFLELDYPDARRWELCINQDVLAKIVRALQRLSSQMKTGFSLTAESLFSIPHLVELRRKELNAGETAFLEKSFEKTLDEMIRMRKREGTGVEKELRKSLGRIKRVMKRLEKIAVRQPQLVREKLINRLKDFSQEIPLSEEKLAEEAAFFAQRSDITEEMARLKSHLDYALELLSPEKEEPVGRKLDFVAQEMFREANTVNSKAQNIELIKDILTVKAEVESIRQQVQNIE